MTLVCCSRKLDMNGAFHPFTETGHEWSIPSFYWTIAMVSVIANGSLNKIRKASLSKDLAFLQRFFREMWFHLFMKWVLLSESKVLGEQLELLPGNTQCNNCRGIVKWKNSPTNIPRGFHVETTWKRSFPRRFNMESTWCVCRVLLK